MVGLAGPRLRDQDTLNFVEPLLAADSGAFGPVPHLPEAGVYSPDHVLRLVPELLGDGVQAYDAPRSSVWRHAAQYAAGRSGSGCGVRSKGACPTESGTAHWSSYWQGLYAHEPKAPPSDQAGGATGCSGARERNQRGGTRRGAALDRRTGAPPSRDSNRPRTGMMPTRPGSASSVYAMCSSHSSGSSRLQARGSRRDGGLLG